MLLLALAGLLNGQCLFAQSPLRQTVTLTVRNQSVDTVLARLSRQSKGSFSYIGAPFRKDSLVSISVVRQPLRTVLDQLFQGKMQYIESGDNIILQRTDAAREKHYTVSGYVRDRLSGQGIENASVYEHVNLTSTFTNHDGYFNLRLRDRGRLPSVQLTVSKEFYLDTLLYLMAGYDREISVTIAPAPTVQLKEFTVTDGVEKTWIGRSLLSSKLRQQTQNISRFFAEKPVQSSLVPTLGSHGKMAGQVVNKFSLNIVGGYAAGLNGVEVAGGFNINKGDVRYAQAAGIFNIVGGHMQGAQVAGGVNRIMKSAKGAQAAGIANVTDSSMQGAQAAGGVNRIRGHVSGVQVAGIANTTHGFKGAQAAGGINHVDGAAEGVQVSGVGNYSRDSLNGAQIAGGLNISAGRVNGWQVAGIGNWGHDVHGLQLAGGGNFAIGSSKGLQLGLFNVTGHLRGLQFGLINFADSSDGASIGLINIVRHNGYYSVAVSNTELLPALLSVKTGRRRFYSILSAGVADNTVGFGFGLGHESRLHKRLSFAAELMQLSLFDREWESWAQVGRLTPQLHLHLTKWLRIHAGPAISVGESNYLREPDKKYPNLYHREGVSVWFGWQAGISIF
ncbi:LA_2272 family surface repeat-containing protein [Chitinophaga lutea]